MSPSGSPLPGLGDYVAPTKAAKKGGGKKIIWESVGAVRVPIYRLKDRCCIAYRPDARGVPGTQTSCS